MHLILPLLVLWFAYMALSAHATVSNLVLGVGVAMGILMLLRPERKPVRWGRLPSAGAALVRYVLFVLHNMIMSGIQTARVVLDPKLPIHTGIIAIPSESESDLGRALSAHAISLPPGELVIETDEDGVMYVHSLDIKTTEQHAVAAQKVQRELLKQIFD